MAQPRRAKKIDNNQGSIVEALSKIPGVSVEVDHDDILVGWKGQNFWYEIKNPDVVNLEKGIVWPSEITKTERKRLNTWPGHYMIVWSLEMILKDMGIRK